MLNLIHQIFFMTKISHKSWTERELDQDLKTSAKGLIGYLVIFFQHLFIKCITSYLLHNRNLSHYRLVLLEIPAAGFLQMEQKKTMERNDHRKRRMKNILIIAIFITSTAGEKPNVHHGGKQNTMLFYFQSNLHHSGITIMSSLLLKLHWYFWTNGSYDSLKKIVLTPVCEKLPVSFDFAILKR